MTLEEIKERVRLPDELRARGISINRAGFCRCPLHQGDNTASFKVYPDNTFHCFGCGAHGDVIDFVRLYDGLDFKEACRRLSGGSLDVGSRRHVALEQMRREAREKAARRREDALKTVGARITHYGRKWRSAEPLSREAADALLKFQLACYKEDCIIDGSYNP